MARPRRKALPPRRVWVGQDKLRIAYYAGQGLSSGQISEAIGGTTPSRVRAFLSKNGLELHGRHGRRVLRVLVRTSHAAAFASLAANREREPEEIAALLIRAAVQRPELIDELIHENDAP